MPAEKGPSIGRSHYGGEPTPLGKAFIRQVEQKQAEGVKVFPEGLRNEMWAKAEEKVGKQTGTTG